MLKTCWRQQHTVGTPLVRTTLCHPHVYHVHRCPLGCDPHHIASMMRYRITPPCTATPVFKKRLFVWLIACVTSDSWMWFVTLIIISFKQMRRDMKALDVRELWREPHNSTTEYLWEKASRFQKSETIILSTTKPDDLGGEVRCDTQLVLAQSMRTYCTDFHKLALFAVRLSIFYQRFRALPRWCLLK